jgi:hypothetical protein
MDIQFETPEQKKRYCLVCNEITVFDVYENGAMQCKRCGIYPIEETYKYAG